MLYLYVVFLTYTKQLCIAIYIRFSYVKLGNGKGNLRAFFVLRCKFYNEKKIGQIHGPTTLNPNNVNLEVPILTKNTH